MCNWKTTLFLSRKSGDLKSNPVDIKWGIGALGTVKKGTNKYLQQTPGNPSLTKIQKIVPTSTAHILTKPLSI